MCNLSFNIAYALIRLDLIDGLCSNLIAQLTTPLPHSARALALILITVNPAMLSSARVFNCVDMLLALCDVPDNMLQFEACMALTNVGSLSESTKNYMLSRKCLQRFELLQCSAHHLVKRASTEAITNLVTQPDAIAHFMKKGGERLRLWLSLARDEEEDLETARAAAGALAMLCSNDDDGPARGLSGSSIPDIMNGVLESSSRDVQLRLVVCLTYIVAHCGIEAAKIIPASSEIFLPAMQAVSEEDSALGKAAVDLLEVVKGVLDERD